MPILSIPLSTQPTRHAGDRREARLELDIQPQGQRQVVADAVLAVDDFAATLADGIWRLTVVDWTDPVNRAWSIEWDPRADGSLSRQVPGIAGLQGAGRIDWSEEITGPDGQPMNRYGIKAQGWRGPWKEALQQGGTAAVEAWALARYGARPVWLDSRLDWVGGVTGQILNPWATPVYEDGGTDFNANADSTVTISPAPSDNNLLAAGFGVERSTSTATPTFPSGFTSDAVQDDTGATDNRWAAVAHKIASSEGTSYAFASESVDSAMGRNMAVVTEWSGMATSTPTDQTINDSYANTATSLDLGPTGTLAQADELTVAIGGSRGSNSTLITWDADITERYTNGSGNGGDGSRFSFGDKVVSSTSAITATMSTASARDLTGALATYKAAGGGGPTFTRKVVFY